MVTAVRLDGPLAADSFVGAMNAERFRVWVKERLVPALCPGDVVVMDNLSCHKDVEARTAIEDAKAGVVYLPPYSPDFNPTENVWSKTKGLLKGMAKRCVSELLSVVAQAVSCITPQDCRGFFRHCGYDT